jgi:hypothetical protein
VSIYVGPYSMCQVIADTPAEFLEVCEKLGVDPDDYPVRLDPKKRPWVVGLGAIELSRREFVVKCEEIGRFGRGRGPNLQQICR